VAWKRSGRPLQFPAMLEWRSEIACPEGKPGGRNHGAASARRRACNRFKKVDFPMLILKQL